MSSRRHAPDRETGYNREDRRERDTRPAPREREAGSRTPVRTTADTRPTTAGESMTVPGIDPRSTAQTRTVVEPRDSREGRSITDPRSARDPRDPTFSRDPRTGGDTGERMPVAGRDVTREARTAAPGMPRDSGRDTRLRPDEVPQRGPSNDYFLPEEGISRDVIQAEICRYLGPDALVRPYRHQDGRKGYLITAYRALTSAMITTLKQDSLKFEAENRRREKAGHRPQTYIPSGYDPSSRMDLYDDDRAAPMARADSRYEYEPEPRRPRAQPPGYDDMMDVDEQPDPRAPRFARDSYESRDPQGRPQVPTNYGQSGREQYPYDSRSDPRLDPRVDPRMDPRGESRMDPRMDIRMDNRMDPRMDARIDPRGDPRIDPRIDPRADQRIDPRGYSQPSSMLGDRDYPMTDRAPAYGDPRTAQPIYATSRNNQFGDVAPSQPSSIPRAAREEAQLYIDPQTGRPVMAPPRSSEIRHARPDRDYDGRTYR